MSLHVLNELVSMHMSLYTCVMSLHVLYALVSMLCARVHASVCVCTYRLRTDINVRFFLISVHFNFGVRDFHRT